VKHLVVILQKLID